MKAPEKPKRGQPCNGCGLCCAVESCQAAGMVGETSTPCRSMNLHDGRFWYGLVGTEKAAGMEPIIGKALGIGTGCLVDF